MTGLKLYFCILHNGKSTEISVHRELSTIHAVWDEVDQERSVGLIHIGFVRPKILQSPQLMKYMGQVLATASIKWALPSEYQSSIAAVEEIHLSGSTLPIHLLLKGFGYEVAEPEASFQTTDFDIHRSVHTIASAALEVLNETNGLLSKEEIFAHIVEQNLYVFRAIKPVSVLKVELERHCQGSDYSKVAAKPIFGKTYDGKFYSLSRTPEVSTGWLLELDNNDKDLFQQLLALGVSDDDSYSSNIENIPDQLRHKADLFRYRVKETEVDLSDPEQLLSITPYRILSVDIDSLHFPIRVTNVLKGQDIGTLAKLQGISREEILKWPNFGKKSLTDLCKIVIELIDELANAKDNGPLNIGWMKVITDEKGVELSPQESETYKIDKVSATPLKEHFENALAHLKKRDRQVIEYRTGYHGKAMTLEEVGKIMGVSRERIRQIQKGCVQTIIDTKFWDDCITIKIGQLLIDRSDPLYLEMLEIEEPWFEGFVANYQHLAAIIELFSEDIIRIIKINGANIVTHIKQDDWGNCVRQIRNSLKDKADEGGWSRADIGMMFRTTLLDKGAAELVPLIWEEFVEILRFEGEEENAILLSFGKTAESVIEAVLYQAEKPLHYSEVAKRATEMLGKTVEERTAHNALPILGAKLFGRGIYGLERFNPISPGMCDNIQLVVEDMLYDGTINKQWHANEILNIIKMKISALPEKLDSYILNLILSHSNKLVYLKRMVWARADSKQSAEDRVDMADAFTQILQDNGGPLKGIEIKMRLQAIRGVAANLQLQPTERMIQIGPDYWGLIDRDVGGTDEENAARLDALYDYLQDNSEKVILVSDVETCLESYGFGSEGPSSYALLNLAQRDERFYLGRSMILELSSGER